MATAEQLVKSREKAILSPRIGKHGKRKATIEKEKRRAIFDAEISQEFKEIIKDARAEYKLDQFIGKAPDKVDITTKGESINNSSEIKELTKKLNELYGNNTGKTN